MNRHRNRAAENLSENDNQVPSPRVGGDLRRLWQSPDIERTLVSYAVRSTSAHVEMLSETGIVDESTARRVIEALEKVAVEINSGNPPLSEGDIDGFAGVERRLKELVGDACRIIRLGNSRSDQWATDVRMWLRDACGQTGERLIRLRETLIKLAERDFELTMPGYVHMQHGGPIFLSQWWMTNESRFSRDYNRLGDLNKRLNLLPLGSSERTQTDERIDRLRVARQLGFDGLIENHLDAVSDRDYLVEFASFAALAALHVSQLSSELIVWSTQEFGFLRWPKTFTFRGQTISQKRIFELLEVLRSRPASMAGRLSELHVTFKGLPISYGQDIEEALPALFDVVHNLNFLLELVDTVVFICQFDESRMKESASPDVASSMQAIDFLIERDVARDKAVRTVEALIGYCRDRRKQLIDLTMNEWTQFSPAFNEEIYDRLKNDEYDLLGSANGAHMHATLFHSISRAQDVLSQDREMLPGG